tara:strand:+ start:149 stop:697 length:549 start_codon:yes stop_codon:yes gene_type:complete
MSLWGDKDLVTSTGTISIDFASKTVTGAGTTFTDHGVTQGDVISVGAGATYGFAVVDSVTNNGSLAIYSTNYFVAGVTTVPASTTFAISQEPLYAMADTAYAAPEVQTGLSTNPVTRVVYGVDNLETAAAADTAYAVTHSGWVGITSYIDMHGNLRVKNEVLVAGGILTTSDAADDSVFPDS